MNVFLHFKPPVILSHFLSLATFESIIRIIQTPNVKKQQNLLSSRTFRTSQDLGVYLKMDFPIFFRLYAVFFTEVSKKNSRVSYVTSMIYNTPFSFRNPLASGGQLRQKREVTKIGYRLASQ